MAVFVLDKYHKPLMPCSNARATKLLKADKARVHKLVPFTIRLVNRYASASVVQPLRIKIDPGSKTTGIALVREKDDGGQAVLNLFELVHRAKQISEALAARRSYRSNRRRRHLRGRNAVLRRRAKLLNREAQLRCRPARFKNRARKNDKLAPSLQHRVDNITAWVKRLRKLAPISGLSMELVRFDTQAMQTPGIQGIEYQQGELAGYELKEYLLEKWGHKCAYCDKQNVPLEIDHIQARSKSGSNRVSNLTLACVPCNKKKSNKDVRDFVKNPERLAKILAHAKEPLRDAAAVNSTRNALHRALQATGLPVETGSGGKTKWNRTRMNVPKTHALDAACVGTVLNLTDWQRSTLKIESKGRGQYQRTKTKRIKIKDKQGKVLRKKTIRKFFMKTKFAYGFMTGDLVAANVPDSYVAVGVHKGRLRIRKNGDFCIETASAKVDHVKYQFCTLRQRADGYSYTFVPLSMEKGKGKGTKRKATKQPALSHPGLKAGVARAK
jgi:5-methylcytosine-specific restriction endonuclease McrA